jgi:hypothetical protein
MSFVSLPEEPSQDPSAPRPGLGRRLLSEVKRWRVTWVGVVLAIVMPLLYLWGGSPQHALVALMAGVGMALSARSVFDDRSDAKGASGGQ